MALIAFVGGPLIAEATGVAPDDAIYVSLGGMIAGFGIIVAVPLINRREIRALRRDLAQQHPDGDVVLVLATGLDGRRQFAVLVAGSGELTLHVDGEPEPRFAAAWATVSGASAVGPAQGGSAVLIVELDGRSDQRFLVMSNNSWQQQRASAVHMLAARINERARSDSSQPKPSDFAHTTVARILPLPLRVIIHASSVLVIIWAMGAAVVEQPGALNDTFLRIVTLVIVLNFGIIVRTRSAIRAARLGW